MLAASARMPADGLRTSTPTPDPLRRAMPASRQRFLLPSKILPPARPPFTCHLSQFSVPRRQPRTGAGLARPKKNPGASLRLLHHLHHQVGNLGSGRDKELVRHARRNLDHIPRPHLVLDAVLDPGPLDFVRAGVL